MKKTRGLSCLFVSLLILAGNFTVYPQTGIRVDCSPGFNGSYITGTWVPVTFLMDNQGPSVSGTVRVSVPYGSIYSRERPPYTIERECHLQGGTVQKIQFTLPVQRGADLTLSMLDGNTEVFRKDFTLFPQNRGPRPVLALSRNPSLDFIQSLQTGGEERYITLYTHPEYLPGEAAGYSAIYGMVIHNAPLSGMAPGQVEAVMNWVRMGGILVIVGGKHSGWGSASSIEPVNPVVPAGYRSVSSLSELERWTGSPLPAASSYPVVQSRPKPGSEVVLAAEGVPLLVMNRLGRGVIWFCAIDHTELPYRGWAGKEILFERLLSEKNLPSGRIGLPITSPLQGLFLPLFSTEDSRPVSPFPAILFFLLPTAALVILLFGMKKRGTLLTVLLVTLPLASGILFLVSRGGETERERPFYSEIAVINPRLNAPVAQVFVTGGFATTAAGIGTVRFVCAPLSVLPEGGTEMTVVDRNGILSVPVSLDNWSGKSIGASFLEPFPFAGRIDPVSGGFRIEVENGSGYEWKDSLFIYRGAPVGRPFDLLPGEKTRITLRYAPDIPFTPDGELTASLENAPATYRVILEYLGDSPDWERLSDPGVLFLASRMETHEPYTDPGNANVTRYLVILGEIPLADGGRG